MGLLVEGLMGVLWIRLLLLVLVLDVGAEPVVVASLCRRIAGCLGGWQ